MSNIAPTSDDLLAAYPQFAGVQYEPLIDQQLAMSLALLDPGAWGDWYSNGVLLDCAHNLYLLGAVVNGSPNAAMQLTVGSVGSISAAGVSTSFNSRSPSDKSDRKAWYEKTVYGQQLLRLWATIAPLGVLGC